MLESYADDEPRSSAALPRLEAEPAASTVTFGPRLVDHADDAERHADLAHLEARWAACSRARPRRPGRAARRRRAGPRRSPCSRSGVEGEPVDDRRVGAVRDRAVDVEPVAVDDAVGARVDRVGDGAQRGVLLGAVQRRRATAASRPRRATASTASRSSAGSVVLASSTAVSVTGTSVGRGARAVPRGRSAAAAALAVAHGEHGAVLGDHDGQRAALETHPAVAGGVGLEVVGLLDRAPDRLLGDAVGVGGGAGALAQAQRLAVVAGLAGVARGIGGDLGIVGREVGGGLLRAGRAVGRRGEREVSKADDMAFLA